ncbi:helix-turn-helix domain-containing protein [Pseudarthrobacter sp. NPDC080039]|uniref:helix-turn-helix domain-containing protein n=1 Tax=unclassified Pseudarthrobacter TaxID=2647000 RepID=UPI00344D6FF2
MNRTRSRLLRFLISHGPASLSDASLALRLSQSTVRRHMVLLRGAGFVTSTAGTFTAQLDQIERQLQELSARFQSRAADFGNPNAHASYPKVLAFHSSECRDTSQEFS